MGGDERRQEGGQWEEMRGDKRSEGESGEAREWDYWEDEGRKGWRTED